MKKIITSLLISLITLSCVSCICTKKDDPALRTLEVYNFSKVNDEYIMKEQLIFTIKDIKSYDWNKHRIVFNYDFLNYLNELY